MGILGLTPEAARQDRELGQTMDQRLEAEFKRREELRKQSQGNNGDSGESYGDVIPKGTTAAQAAQQVRAGQGGPQANAYMAETEVAASEDAAALYERQSRDAEMATAALRGTAAAQNAALNAAQAATPGPDQAPTVDIRLGADEDEEGPDEEEDLGRKRRPAAAFGVGSAGIKI